MHLKYKDMKYATTKLQYLFQLNMNQICIQVRLQLDQSIRNLYTNI